ncbi:hypothetical protein N836_17895 [Leptolyngbya sp. Heron Island J]|nr:hypothetical protein [Leptolyngbya sp. Heron Island J]ESA34290.1 hypothetical protein N836_17895 [Leptolyngbya sp. Heron Island J]
MGKLVIPKLSGKQIGQVITPIQVANRIDQVLHERKFMPIDEIR